MTTCRLQAAMKRVVEKSWINIVTISLTVFF